MGATEWLEFLIMVMWRHFLQTIIPGGKESKEETVALSRYLPICCASAAWTDYMCRKICIPSLEMLSCLKVMRLSRIAFMT